ncbi:exocyst complex component 2 [Echinococcus multilocularis]|uniref:Exocyst complex component 2 n=1 Tax=Echinococcus multilocularis TaxID=6211 RepID=A0A068XXP7_ECHMU|nr:exocyst complex component 2 [Echinococcus multilocularis]
MSASGPPAQVTGISPIEGVPGTKLTLRGEHFGQSALDLTHVFVGGIDVSPSARWFSSRKLSVITPLGTGELEIVVVTRSGGIGTSELTYTQNVGQKVGPQEQVSYWPEDERRRCPAIIERGSGTRQEGGGDVVDASLAATGLPAAELARLGIPLSDTALMKIYPCSGSVLLSEPDFDPLLFLLKYYKNASFEDLVMARNNFSRSIAASGGHDSSHVIKNNLYLIFRCLEGLEDLRNEMKRSNVPGNYEYKPSGQKTRSKVEEGTVETRLEKKLTDSWNQGYDLFKDVLRCREAANSARNVLSIMERFSFLFRLPESIRKTIKEGEYNLAISDYKRAKALFSTSDCGAFQRVFVEIENVVAQFCNTLKTELLEVPIDVDEAMRRIKCLEQLDVDYDPYWICAEAFKNWLVEQLRGFQKRYQEEVKVSSSSQLEISKTPSEPILCSTVKGRMSNQQMIVQLVKQACNLLSTQCVQFWRLQAVCLAASSKSKPNVLERTDSQQSRQAKYQTINLELVHLLANCIREVVLQPASVGTLETVSSGWASTCVQEFRNCCLSLPLDVVPRDAQAVLRRLSYDLRRHAVRDVLRSSQTTTESLHFKENWEVEVTDDGGSITQLPLAYENAVSETLSRCKTLMSSRTSLENSLFDAPEYQERFSQSFSDVMLGFLGTLQHLAEQIKLSLPWHSGATEMSQHDDQDGLGTLEPTVSQKPIIAQARGVLLLLSNADWAARHANAHVFSAYATAGFSNVEDLKSRVSSSWKAVTEKLIDLYVNIRTRWLCAPLDNTTPDNALQSAMITALCNLSHIHAELVLLLGISTAAQVNADKSGGDSDDVLLSCDRTQSIMQTVAAKLADSIRTRSGDVVDDAASCDMVQANVNFILDLLKLLISGKSLEQFFPSKKSALDLKRSLRLVAKALDAGGTFEESQGGLDSPSTQSHRTRNLFIRRPHLRRH